MREGDNGNSPDSGLRDWVPRLSKFFTFGWMFAYPALAVLGTLVILIYALQLPSGVRWGAFATAILIGSCSFMSGGLLGFLFGIPRTLQSETSETVITRYKANTNLEEISDWVTKIIVGVGLVQIGRALPALSRLAASLKAPLGGQASSPAFGLSLVIVNVLLGFLFFYLWTRSLLTPNLAFSDSNPPDAKRP